MNRKVFVCLSILGIMAAAVLLYVYSPFVTGQSDLNEAQRESLCNEFVKEGEESYGAGGGYLPEKTVAAVKIFGVDRENDTGYVYGCVSVGTYVEFKEKA